MNAPAVQFQLSVYADDNRPVMHLPLDPRCVSVAVATAERTSVRLEHVHDCQCAVPCITGHVDTVPTPRAAGDDQ